MKKLIFIFLAVMFLFVAVGTASGTQIWDNPDYVASTGLNLGAKGMEFYGTEGWTIIDPFQINLMYQAGIENGAIDAFNSYDPNDTWDVNFSDNNEYVLNVQLSGLPTYVYPAQMQEGESGIQWTLTGWGQTIFAGDIVDQHDGTLFLRVLPTATYRPFPNDPLVNDVEVFDGNVDSEILGYVFHGDLSGLENMDGSSLDVRLQPVPEPATMLLLGSGLIGLLGFRRRSRKG